MISPSPNPPAGNPVANAELPRPLRIAYLISTLEPGGAERQVINTVNGLPDWIHGTLFVLRDQVRLAEQLSNPRVQLRVIGLKGRGDVQGWARLANELRAQRPDILHSHMALSNLGARLLRPWIRPGALINHEHGLAGWKGPALRWAERASQRLADRIVVVSRASLKVRVERSKVDPERLTVLPNAIPYDVMRAVPPAPSNRETATWGIAARFHPKKRVDLAIDLVAEARRQGYRRKLLIAGEGEDLDRLQAHARSLGVEDSVEFLGHVADMPGFYASVDVVLLTSETEDCPMTVLEALAAGKFMAATAVGGVPELLENAADACLITDTVNLEPAVKALVAVGPGFDSAKNRAYAERFSIEAYVAQLTSLYLDTLKHAARA